MQYNDNYEYDHSEYPECETPDTEEFASDFIVETDTDEYRDEFNTTPDEFVGSEYGSDEQAATTDEGNIDSPYGNIDAPKPQPYLDEERQNYNTESSEDMTDNYETNDEQINDKSIGYVTDPSAEQAAVSDDGYCCGIGVSHCDLDDYEIISDVLGSEKQLVKLYSTALCEAAEENFRDIIRENFTEVAADQYKAFTFMQERGMYKTEQAPENKITEAKQQFTPLCENCKID